MCYKLVYYIILVQAQCSVRMCFHYQVSDVLQISISQYAGLGLSHVHHREPMAERCLQHVLDRSVVSRRVTQHVQLAYQLSSSSRSSI